MKSKKAPYACSTRIHKNPKNRKSNPKPKRRDIKAALSIKLPKDYPWVVLSEMVEEFFANQYILEDDYALMVQIIRDRDIFAYSLLMDAWGLQSINTQCGGVPDYIVWARYQLAALLYKFRFKTEKHVREAAAKQKFILAEAMCGTYNHSGYKSLTWPEEDWLVDVFTYARNWLRKLLGDEIHYSKLTEWVRHGPGSTLETEQGRNSVFFKYAEWPYTCTPDALLYARNVIMDDERWFGALQDSYRARFEIPQHFPLNMEVFWRRVIKVVQGNRICFVPKNAKTERSIAIEPLMNLYLQLGVDGFIRRRLKHWDVDLDDQRKNQEMARLGSTVQGDESYITLDLSMASDSLSLRLCKELLPPAWYRYLSHLRCPIGELDGEIITYEKISSMGNGYTFALESAVFAAICSAVIRQDQGSCNWKSDLCIFGDDIIVRRKVTQKVIKALQSCGFAINTDKSFLFGQVRESCGTDWRNGKPLRPVFLVDTPVNVQDLLIDRNRLNRILELRLGEERSKLVEGFGKWFPSIMKDYYGPYSDTDFGSYIHSSVPGNRAKRKNDVWWFHRIISHPVAVRGARVNQFLFRKLMHDLRKVPVPPPSYKTKGGSEASCRFMVCLRDASTISVKYRPHRDWWEDTYAETMAS